MNTEIDTLDWVTIFKSIWNASAWAYDLLNVLAFFSSKVVLRFWNITGFYKNIFFNFIFMGFIEFKLQSNLMLLRSYKWMLNSQGV